jgi:hypothetical protein
MVGLRSFDLRSAVVCRNSSPSWSASSGASVYIGAHFLACIWNLLRCSRAFQRNLVESDVRRDLIGVFDLDGLSLSWRWVMTMPNTVTSADGGWRALFAFVAQWPAAAQFRRSRITGNIQTSRRRVARSPQSPARLTHAQPPHRLTPLVQSVVGATSAVLTHCPSP